MNLLNLAYIYIQKTKPNILKKQKIKDVFDAMKLIRRYLDNVERNKTVRKNQLNNNFKK